MIEQALKVSEKKRDSRVAEMAKTMIIDALDMCAVEGQDGAVRSVASLTIRPFIEDVLDEGVVAAQIQNVAMRAVVHLVMIQAATDALLKEDQMLGPIATFV